MINYILKRDKKKFLKKSIDIIFIITKTNLLGNKDVDHFLPFFYFLSKNKKFNYTARGLILDSKENFYNNKDPKINFLSNLKNIDLEFMHEGFFINLIKKFKFIIIDNNWAFSNYLMIILSKLEFLISKKINLKDKIGRNFLYSEKPIVIVLKRLKIASEIKIFNKKAKVIELTHGSIVCDNQMVHDFDLDRTDKNDKIHYKNLYKNIDYLARTNKREVAEDIAQGIDKNKIIAIGSPRYCKEWLKVKSKFKLDGKDVKLNKKYKVKILFILPKSYINIFWDELIRTIDFISSYEQFKIILLNDNKYFPKIPNNIKKRDNLSIYLISKEYSSSKLIDWADIVLHAGTGVIWDCFMKEKITVLPKYLTCNTLISDKYGAGYNLNNRDELRKLCNEALISIENLKKNYNKKHKRNNQKFINDFVYAKPNSVPHNIDKLLLKTYKLF
jgi:hypothetical protein